MSDRLTLRHVVGSGALTIPAFVDYGGGTADAPNQLANPANAPVVINAIGGLLQARWTLEEGAAVVSAERRGTTPYINPTAAGERRLTLEGTLDGDKVSSRGTTPDGNYTKYDWPLYAIRYWELNQNRVRVDFASPLYADPSLSDGVGAAAVPPRDWAIDSFTMEPDPEGPLAIHWRLTLRS